MASFSNKWKVVITVVYVNVFETDSPTHSLTDTAAYTAAKNAKRREGSQANSSAPLFLQTMDREPSNGNHLELDRMTAQLVVSPTVCPLYLTILSHFSVHRWLLFGRGEEAPWTILEEQRSAEKKRAIYSFLSFSPFIEQQSFCLTLSLTVHLATLFCDFFSVTFIACSPWLQVRREVLTGGVYLFWSYPIPTYGKSCCFSAVQIDNHDSTVL